jgi:hypothetical protein
MFDPHWPDDRRSATGDRWRFIADHPSSIADPLT